MATMYIPTIVWMLSALAYLYIAKRKAIKLTAAKEVAVALAGPFAVLFILLAKTQRH